MLVFSTTLSSENYYPQEKRKWVKYDSMTDTKNLIIYRTCLYNSSKRKKVYYLALWAIYNELDNTCILLIGGRLKFWFHQDYEKKELTDDEYTECLRLLHIELDLNTKEERLFTSKHVILREENGEYRCNIYNRYFKDL